MATPSRTRQTKGTKKDEHEYESEILGRPTLPTQARAPSLAPDSSRFPLFHFGLNGRAPEGIEKELSPRGHNRAGDQEGHKRHDAQDEGEDHFG